MNTSALAFVLAGILAALTLGGCATYKTPGGAVSIPDITAPGIADAMAREPAATWPARLIVARVQGPGYESYSSRGYGHGRFSVITTRDIETEADFARLGAMPQVAGVGVLGRLLLPENLQSATDLRTAAAHLKGDIVLMYTVDTAFRTESTQIGPLQLVSLGFFPNKKAKVTSTCSAALIDTRTGFVYGVAEATSPQDQRSDVWDKQEAIEKARARAEREAFVQALGEVEKLWVQVAAAQTGGGSGSTSVTP
jgi:hypothetical protein